MIDNESGEIESDEAQREMAQKYKELRKREIQMDEFLNNFEETKQNQMEELLQTRKTIVQHLELVSKVIFTNFKLLFCIFKLTQFGDQGCHCTK